MLMKRIVECLVLVTSQNGPIANLVFSMKVQVVEGVHKDLEFVFEIKSCPFQLPCICE